ELLFRKIEDAEIEAQRNKLHEAAKNKAVTNNVTTPTITMQPVAPTIDFDQFAAIDLRIGTIIAAEKVAKADKLLQLTVDMGFENRTIVSGIAEHFSPKEIIGQQ